MPQQIVTLAPGESQVASFTTTPNLAKTYRVQLDGLSGNFVAKSESPFALSIHSPQGVDGKLFAPLGAESLRVTLNDWRANANQALSTILSTLANPRTIFYSHNGYGSANRFHWGNYEGSFSAARYSSIMARRAAPIIFSMLQSCDSMTNADRSGTFAYHLTKGFSPGAAVVGFSGFDRLPSECYEYHWDMIDWFYDYLLRGYPIYKAYLLSVEKCLATHGWNPSGSFRFLGDQSSDFRLVPQQKFPEEEP